MSAPDNLFGNDGIYRQTEKLTPRKRPALTPARPHPLPALTPCPPSPPARPHPLPPLPTLGEGDLKGILPPLPLLGEGRGEGVRAGVRA